MISDPDLTSAQHDIILEAEARNAETGQTNYDDFNALRESLGKPPLIATIGYNIPWAMKMLEPFVGGFSLQIRKDRTLAESIESLQPGKENTLLIVAHGRVSDSLMYPNRFFEAYLTDNESLSLESLLEGISQSKSAFTHIIFGSCNSGQIIEDFMLLQKSLPELTKNVNLYIPVGRYQLYYTNAVDRIRYGNTASVRLVPTSSLEAALDNLVQGIEEGLGIASKAIINGKAYDPLKTAIKRVKTKLQDDSLPPEQRKQYQTLLTDLQAIRNITESSNRRELYRHLLQYKQLHPEAVSQLVGKKYTTEDDFELLPLSFRSNLPVSYTLTSKENFPSSPNHPKVIIPQEVADFVAEVAKEEFGALLPEGHFMFRKAKNRGFY